MQRRLAGPGCARDQHVRACRRGWRLTARPAMSRPSATSSGWVGLGAPRARDQVAERDELAPARWAPPPRSPTCPGSGPGCARRGRPSRRRCPVARLVTRATFTPGPSSSSKRVTVGPRCGRPGGSRRRGRRAPPPAIDRPPPPGARRPGVPRTVARSSGSGRTQAPASGPSRAARAPSSGPSRAVAPGSRCRPTRLHRVGPGRFHVVERRVIGVARRPRSIEVRFSVGLGALHERSRGWSGGCPEALRLTVEGCARRGRPTPAKASPALARPAATLGPGRRRMGSVAGTRSRPPPPAPAERPARTIARTAVRNEMPVASRNDDHEEGDAEDRGAGDPEALREWSTDQGPEPAAGLREGVGGPVDGRPPTGQLRQPGDGHEPEERADEAPDGVGTTPDRDDRRAAGHENRRHEEPHHPDQVTQGRVGAP